MNRLLHAAVLAALVVGVTPVRGQALDINLDALSALAEEEVIVDLAGETIAQLKQQLPDEAGLPLAGIRKVLVRHFEFGREGAYSSSDVEPIRNQVRGAEGWARVVAAKERNQNVEIYAFARPGEPGGFLLIVQEPRELTVVHIEGELRLDQLEAVVESTIQYQLADAR